MKKKHQKARIKHPSFLTLGASISTPLVSTAMICGRIRGRWRVQSLATICMDRRALTWVALEDSLSRLKWSERERRMI